MRRSWWILVGLVLALVCYLLPWYTHKTAGFTTNAFDLAEWVSIHPAVRSSSPPMLTSFLLRLPQITLVAAVALIANRFEDARWRWIMRAGALLLVLRFVPPSDFFTNATDDPNYRQMALMTALGIGFTGAAMLMFRLSQNWQNVALAGVLVLGVLAGWMGLSDAGTLLDNFEIDVKIGPGIIGYTLCAGIVLVIAFWPRTNGAQRYGLSDLHPPGARNRSR
jgi:hypothetical protein